MSLFSLVSKSLALLLFGAIIVEAIEAQSSRTPLSRRRGLFRVEVQCVNVLVTVQDKKTGKFVADLKADDFRIFEEKDLQEITNFAQQMDLPLAIAVGLDTSGSIKPITRLRKGSGDGFYLFHSAPCRSCIATEVQYQSYSSSGFHFQSQQTGPGNQDGQV